MWVVGGVGGRAVGWIRRGVHCRVAGIWGVLHGGAERSRLLRDDHTEAPLGPSGSVAALLGGSQTAPVYRGLTLRAPIVLVGIGADIAESVDMLWVEAAIQIVRIRDRPNLHRLRAE